MKKASEDMLPEYDFSQGVRGKYAARFLKGTKRRKKTRRIYVKAS